MRHPYIAIGVERYGRTAAAHGLEPRHPLLDRRLVELCVALPGEQKLANGWPKAVLRRAMVGRLPDAVRRRRGKEHLGWAFSLAVLHAEQQRLRSSVTDNADALAPYVDADKLRADLKAHLAGGDVTSSTRLFQAAALAQWLARRRSRPTSKGVLLP
jgi:asparagine synthase (glutamine-hydrolysing)